MAYSQGVDLSSWQGDIDFPKLATKASYAYLRAGIGNNTYDQRVNEYRHGCEDNGIEFGLYWFVKPGKNFHDHAQNFALKWQENPGTLPPCFDLEESGGLGKTALESWLKKMYDHFCALTNLEYQGVMTYTRASFLDTAIGLTNWLKYTQLWVANWTTGPDPVLPQEWAKPGFTWVNWQYSNKGDGPAYGVESRNIDLDRAKFGVIPPPIGDGMKYNVTQAGNGLKIRSTPFIKPDNILGTRATGSVVTPIETTGDSSRYNSYWVRDALGWSAAQWYGAIYMQPFV